MKIAPRYSFRLRNLIIAGRPVHYAWVIVGVAAVMRLFSSSFRSSSSILIPRLVDSFGWSYGAVGFGFALQWVVSGLLGPSAGWLGDRYGARVAMTIGALLFIAGMTLTGLMTSLWQFYLFFGIILSASMGIFQVPLTASVTMWFKRHLGAGMGLLQSAQGVGPLVAVPVMLLVIELFGGGLDGLRAAFWVPGIIGGAALLLLVRLFYNEPAQIGLRPLGAPESEPVRRVQTGEIAKVRTRVFFKQAQRTLAFWNLIGIHFWGCAGHAIVLVYLVAIAEDGGGVAGAGGGGVCDDVGDQHGDPVRGAGDGRPGGQQGGDGGVFRLADAAHRIVVFRRGAVALLPVRGVVRHRVRRGDERLSDNQPAVLRQRPHRHHLRLADDGRGGGDGRRVADRRLAAGCNGQFRRHDGAVAGLEPGGGAVHNAAAHHPPPPVAGLGAGAAAGGANAGRGGGLGGANSGTVEV